MKDNTAHAFAFTAYPFVEPGSKPHVAVSDASAALKAVTALIDGRASLPPMGDRDLHGLAVIFKAITRVMDGAADLLTPPKTPIQEFIQHSLDVIEREIDASGGDFDEGLARAERKLRRRRNDEPR